MDREDAKKAAAERMAFGEFLRMNRKEADIGLRDFARRVGVSPAYVSRIEHGRDNPPKVETLEKMEKILELEPGTLVVAAKKAPSAFIDAMTKSKINREMLPRFMRIVRSGKLGPDDWEKIIKDAEKRSKTK